MQNKYVTITSKIIHFSSKVQTTNKKILCICSNFDRKYRVGENVLERRINLARKETKHIGQIVDIMEKLTKNLASLHYRYLFLKLF